MRSTWMRAALTALAMTTVVACGDDDDGTEPLDGGGSDASVRDAGRDASDEPGPDAGMIDATVGDDASTPDGGTDAAMSDAGSDAGPTPSQRITAVRMLPPGAANLPIEDAIVTYVKPFGEGVTDSDPLGFFLQAEPAGPALFVAVDPSTLDPVPAVGDTVSFTVTMTEVVRAQRRVTALTDWAVSDSGGETAVLELIQDASTANLVGAAESYESEILTLEATLAGDTVSCGTGYVCAQFTSTGVTAPVADARIRVPQSVAVARGLRDDCEIVLGPSPLWRFDSASQPSAWTAEGVEVVMCPVPEVASASATDATTVRVVFDAPLARPTLTTAAFTVTGGATPVSVTAVEYVEGDRFVTLTTSALSVGTTYTVTVATSVTDPNGIALSATANTAMFEAAAPCDDLVINELQVAGAGSGTANNEFVEIYNGCPTALDLQGYRLVYRSSGATGASDTATMVTIGAVTLAPDTYVVYANSGWSGGGAPTSAGTFMQGLSGTSGGVGLRDPAGLLVDSLTWGAVPTMPTAHPFIEGTTAAVPPGGSSLARTPNGNDTNNNMMNFTVDATPTPGAPNG